MEGTSESFQEFFKFILIVGFIILACSVLKHDMEKRGVFGIEKQREVLTEKKQEQILIFNNNPATIRYAW